MLPSDSFILLSWVNTQLRDRYDDLNELCEDQDVAPQELKKKLSAIGYQYDAERNCFR